MASPGASSLLAPEHAQSSKLSPALQLLGLQSHPHAPVDSWQWQPLVTDSTWQPHEFVPPG